LDKTKKRKIRVGSGRQKEGVKVICAVYASEKAGQTNVGRWGGPR